MKTKYKKVQTSERLPEKEGNYICIFFNGDALSIPYWKEFSFALEFTDCSGITHWLEEVPDYEEEILAMLERMKINIVFTSIRGFDKPLTLEEVDRFSRDVDDLIEKIKHGKVS